MNEDSEVICAWCKKHMGIKTGTETNITHGICPDCNEKLKRDVIKIKSR